MVDVVKKIGKNTADKYAQRVYKYSGKGLVYDQVAKAKKKEVGTSTKVVENLL